MKALSRYLAPLKPGRSVLLWGEHLRPLAAAAAAWGVARGTPVLVVDAANRFDPYGLVREAAGRGLAPQDALAQVRVARAFTCHQLVRLVEETFPAILAPGCLVLRPGTGEPVLRRTGALGGTAPPLSGPDEPPGPDQVPAALLLLQPLMPREASNRHFGKLLAPVIDYFVEVESREGRPGAGPRAIPAVAVRPPGTLWGGPHHAAPSRPQRGEL